MSAQTLVIVDRSSKSKALSNGLWQSGIHSVEIVAAGNQSGAIPELAQGGHITRSASAAQVILLAMDDDAAGDVLAGDIVRLCINTADRLKVRRLRARSLAPFDIKRALDGAETVDLAASGLREKPGQVSDAGGLRFDGVTINAEERAVILCLQTWVPIQGIMTFTLKARDDRGDWVAHLPMRASQAMGLDGEVEYVASVGASQEATLARQAMNYDEMLLRLSLSTGSRPRHIARMAESLYERGLLTYPFARSRTVSTESFNRVAEIARVSGAGFEPNRFGGLLKTPRLHSHEAPNATLINLDVNAVPLGLEQQVLIGITRHLIECGIRCAYETPQRKHVAILPGNMARLGWHRIIPVGARLWETDPVKAGYTRWTPEQSLLHLVMKQELGNPATLVKTVERIIGLELVNDSLELTRKGMQWGAVIAAQKQDAVA